MSGESTLKPKPFGEVRAETIAMVNRAVDALVGSMPRYTVGEDHVVMGIPPEAHPDVGLVDVKDVRVALHRIIAQEGRRAIAALGGEEEVERFDAELRVERQKLFWWLDENDRQEAGL